MSILALLLIFVALLALLTIPAFRYGRSKNLEDGPSTSDDLYAELYDAIYFENHEKLANEMQFLTAPEGSHVLDVGCGTGNRVGWVKKNAVGVDVSPSMVAMAKKKYPKCDFLVGDVLKKATFEKGAFTEIWCLGNMVYCFKHKLQFLQNAHSWLEAGGVLVLEMNENPRFCNPCPYKKNFGYDMKRFGNTCRERMKYKNKKAVVETTFYPISLERLKTMTERVGFELDHQEHNFYFYRKSSLSS